MLKLADKSLVSDYDALASPFWDFCRDNMLVCIDINKGWITVKVGFRFGYYFSMEIESTA